MFSKYSKFFFLELAAAFFKSAACSEKDTVSSVGDDLLNATAACEQSSPWCDP